MDLNFKHTPSFKSHILIGVLCLITILVLSCSKEESAFIKGQVLDNTDGKPIAGIRLFLIHEFKNKNEVVEQIIVDSTKSDAMGFYRLQYHKQMFENYYLSWKNDLPNFLPVAGGIHAPHKRFASTVFLTPVGFLRIRLKKNGNTPSFIKVFPQSATPGNIPVIMRNVPFDTTFQTIFTTSSGVNNHIIFDFYAHSTANPERKNETFNINKGDTVLHTIEFE